MNSLSKYPASDMLVCWLKSREDLSVLLNEGWYRIPVSTKLENLRKVKFLSFYNSYAFGNEKCVIKHYGTIDNMEIAKRKDLFPKEKKNSKSENEYYKIFMKDMNILRPPVKSKRSRKIIFINTTLKKLLNAKDYNDLFHGSPLEDNLWAEFKKNEIAAERQFLVGYTKNYYSLDFAAFCQKGNLDVECDGDAYHINKEKAVSDNRRDNYLTKKGWSILRYSTGQLKNINECVNEISETIKKKGGILPFVQVQEKPTAPPEKFTYKIKPFENLIIRSEKVRK
jgi:very-short-patch-repair endonuclease